MTAPRTYYLRTLLSAVLILATARAYAQATAGIPEKILAYPEMIVLNAKIATMDEKMTSVQAMAVRSGRLLALGTSQEMKKLAGPKTQLIDAKGRAVLPGLVDAHTHPHLFLMNHFARDQKFIVDPQLQLTLVSGSSTAEIHKTIEPAVRKRAAELGPGKWVIIKLPKDDQRGTPRSSVLDQHLIRSEDLDSAAPNNPVLVAADYSNGVYNSKAKEIMLAKAGKELSSFSLWYLVIYDSILDGKTAAVKDLLKAELQEYAMQGTTTVGTNVESPEIFKALNEMDNKGEMPIRWGSVHRTGYSRAKDPAEFYRLLGDFAGQGDEYLWSLGAGSENWEGGGNPGNCTRAVPKDPDLQKQIASRGDPCAGHRPGTVNYDAHLATIEAGLRFVNVHASRDGTLDILLEMLDQAVRDGAVTVDQIRERRFYFDHGVTIRPDQIPLLKKYAIAITFQGVNLDQGSEIERVYGAKYLKWLMPAKTLLDAGVRFVISSDVHMVDIPPELRLSGLPWHGIWSSLEGLITREVDGRAWELDEKLDRVTTLRGITNWGALLMLREKDLGSLEAGKLADFTIIDKDYFTVPEREIHTIKSLLTVVGGKVVYRSPEL